MVQIPFDRAQDLLRRIKAGLLGTKKRRSGMHSLDVGKENIWAHRLTHLSHCDLVRHEFRTYEIFQETARATKRGTTRPHLSDWCTCNALAIPERSELTLARNIITDNGDVFYAESTAVVAGNATHTVAFAGANGRMVLSTSAFSPSPSKTSHAGHLSNTGTVRKAFTSGYPDVNDPDANNPGTTGVDILSWDTAWTTAEANGTNVSACIALSTTTFGSGTDPILNAADVLIIKTSSDTLTTYVNHEFLGV